MIVDCYNTDLTKIIEARTAERVARKAVRRRRYTRRYQRHPLYRAHVERALAAWADAYERACRALQ